MSWRVSPGSRTGRPGSLADPRAGVHGRSLPSLDPGGADECGAAEALGACGGPGVPPGRPLLSPAEGLRAGGDKPSAPTGGPWACLLPTAPPFPFPDSQVPSSPVCLVRLPVGAAAREGPILGGRRP